VTTSWTKEAEQRMQRVPSFVRGMASMAILRYAQERGHTVITARIVEQATANLMPGHAEQAMAEIVAADAAGELGRERRAGEIEWSSAARTLLQGVEDVSLRANLAMRAEKKARALSAPVVAIDHVRAFVTATESNAGPNGGDEPAQHWQASALARLMRVPEGFMRDAARDRIERYADEQRITEIDLEVAERGLVAAREAMRETLGGGESAADGPAPRPSKCPFANPGALFSGAQEGVGPGSAAPPADTARHWTADAESLLDRVPQGFCRDMTRRAAETIAVRAGAARIDAEFVERVQSVFAAGAATVSESLTWSDDARARIARAPEMVRGMLVREIEAWAGRNGLERVEGGAVDAVKREWQQGGVFHLDPFDDRNCR